MGASLLYVLRAQQCGVPKGSCVRLRLGFEGTNSDFDVSGSLTQRYATP